MNKCKDTGCGIASMIIFNVSDVKEFKNGFPVKMKRKYGKFKRKVYKIDNTKK